MKRLIRRYLFQASLRRGSTVMGGPHRRTAHRARRRRRNMNDMGVDHVHHPVVHPDSLTPPRQPRFGTDFDDLMINSQMSHKRETSDTNKPRASPHDQRQQSNGEHQRSEEHTSELQSLMRISYAVFCLKKKKKNKPYEQQPT